MDATKAIKLASSIFLCEMAGIVGSLFTAPAIPLWYEALAKPEIVPPSWVFAPVWIALYALMGFALYRLRENHGKNAKALAAFAVQLALNIAWSVVFFGMREIAFGLAIIIALWIAIAATIALSWNTDRAAAVALAPYLAWVSFAAYLNWGILALN